MASEAKSAMRRARRAGGAVFFGRETRVGAELARAGGVAFDVGFEALVDGFVGADAPGDVDSRVVGGEVVERRGPTGTRGFCPIGFEGRRGGSSSRFIGFGSAE